MAFHYSTNCFLYNLPYSTSSAGRRASLGTPQHITGRLTMLLVPPIKRAREDIQSKTETNPSQWRQAVPTLHTYPQCAVQLHSSAAERAAPFGRLQSATHLCHRSTGQRHPSQVCFLLVFRRTVWHSRLPEKDKYCVEYMRGSVVLLSIKFKLYYTYFCMCT